MIMSAKLQYTMAFKLARMFRNSRMSYNQLQEAYSAFYISPKFAHLAFKSLNARTVKMSPTQAFVRAMRAMEEE